MNKQDLIKVIDSIVCRGKAYCSEADFQLELARELQNSYPSDKVRCEYCPGEYYDDNDKSIHIDIMIIDDKCNMIPIELKYKTVEDEVCTKCGDSIVLKNQLAYNYACYDFWKDVKRIEDLKTFYKSNMEKGFVVFLTNSTNYWQHDPSRKSSNYDNFRIYDGREVFSGSTLKWGTSLPSDKSRSGSITLKNRHVLDWRYHDIVDCVSYGSTAVPEKKYNYLVLEV